MSLDPADPSGHSGVSHQICRLPTLIIILRPRYPSHLACCSVIKLEIHEGKHTKLEFQNPSPPVYFHGRTMTRRYFHIFCVNGGSVGNISRLRYDFRISFECRGSLEQKIVSETSNPYHQLVGWRGNERKVAWLCSALLQASVLRGVWRRCGLALRRWEGRCASVLRRTSFHFAIRRTSKSYWTFQVWNLQTCNL